MPTVVTPDPDTHLTTHDLESLKCDLIRWIIGTQFVTYVSIFGAPVASLR